MLFGIETHFYEINPRFSDMGALKMSARSERRSQKGERERERRSEKKLRARARAALVKTKGERKLFCLRSYPIFLSFLTKMYLVFSSKRS